MDMTDFSSEDDWKEGSVTLMTGAYKNVYKKKVIIENKEMYSVKKVIFMFRKVFIKILSCYTHVLFRLKYNCL